MADIALVTGASGFVGSAVARALAARGLHVRVLMRANASRLNVSGLHCELNFREGVWYLRDMGSTNGVKVNDQRVQEKLLRPGDEINIAKRRFTIQYAPPADAVLEDESAEDILGTSLLEKAGLARTERKPIRPRPRAVDPNELSLRRSEEEDE